MKNSNYTDDIEWVLSIFAFAHCIIYRLHLLYNITPLESFTPRLLRQIYVSIIRTFVHAKLLFPSRNRPVVIYLHKTIKEGKKKKETRWKSFARTDDDHASTTWQTIMAVVRGEFNVIYCRYCDRNLTIFLTINYILVRSRGDNTGYKLICYYCIAFSRYFTCL